MSSSFSSSSHSSSRNQQQQQQQQRAMPFQLFLEKMRQPLAAELVSGIKHFINTFVLEEDKEEGEEEGGGGKKKSKQRDSAKDSEKIQRFLRAYEEKFRRHSLWRNCSSEEVEASTEGLEKYVCTKLYSTIFNAYGEEDDAINDALQKRVEALRNLPLTPEMLDVSRKQFLLLGEEEEGGGADEGNGKPAVGDGMPTTPTSSSSNDENNNNNNNKSPHQNNNIPKSLRLASMELEKMNTYKAPRDKMNCVLNACRIISNAVLRFSGGADAFIPSLIYSLAHANVQNLWKNIKYIERFRLRDRLEQGEAAYFFINVESGARFLGTCGKEQLNIFSDEKDDAFPEPVDGLLVSFSASRELEEEEEEEEEDKKQVARSRHLTTPEQPKTPPFNGFVVSSGGGGGGGGQNDDDTGTPPLATMNIQNEIEIIETMGASLSLSNESDYHFINADHEHLTIGDIKTLLISYKNLANKYEALKRGIEMKLRETRESGDSYSSLLTAAEEADDENDDEEEEEKGDVVVATTTSITTSPAAPPSLL